MKRASAGLEPLRIGSVMVPLDGSPFAEQALPWAIAIVRKTRARLRLTLVHQSPRPAPVDEATLRLHTRMELMLRKSEREYLRALAARIKSEHGVQATAAMLQGSPAPILRDYVTDIGVDLVVMTTHGRGGIQRLWLGSVADHLVRSAEVPMLLVRPVEGPVPSPAVGQILIPLDGSPRAEAALPPAMAMAATFGAGLALLTAVHPVPVVIDPPTSFPTEINEELTALQRSQAQDYLDGVVGRLNEAGVRASGAAVLAGRVFDAIQAAAQARGTGMVALATHGRGGLRRMVLGSVADKLVRAGELPVLVTRPHAR